MKTPHVVLFLFFASAAIAETIEVYSCSNGFLNPKDPTEENRYATIGERIAMIDTGDKTLRAIVREYEPKSWKAEPFYGPVKKYVFKDSSARLYVVHFEYEIGHRTFGEGMRFAIIELTKVPGSKDKYAGSPYFGSSVFDETILKQLRTLADRRAREKKND